MLPGFSPELQGVYSETDPDGIKRLYGYVLKGLKNAPPVRERCHDCANFLLPDMRPPMTTQPLSRQRLSLIHI